MPEYLAPGVFVEETSFRAKSIEGVSTTTTGFIGPTRSGPVHLEPDIITSLTEFEEIYGDGNELEFDGGNVLCNHIWQGVRAFFENGGKRAYIARVFSPLPGAGDSGDRPTRYEPIDSAFEESASVNLGTGTAPRYQDGHARVHALLAQGLAVRARHPGAAGNGRVLFQLKAGGNILGNDTDPVTRRSIATLRSLRDLDIVWKTDRVSPDLDDIGGFYVAHWDEDRAVWEFEPVPRESPDQWLALDELFPSGANPDEGDAVRLVTLTVTLQSRDGTRDLGTWADLPLAPGHQAGGGGDSLFDRFATTPPSAADAIRLPLVIARIGAGVAGAADVLELLFDGHALDRLRLEDHERLRGIRVEDKLMMGIGNDMVLEGGNDGERPDAGAFEGEARLDKNYALGLRQFEGIEDISILAAPGSTADYENYRLDADAIQGLLISHCERMKYRIAVLDSAPRQTISEVRNMRGRLDSKYAALYYPWVTILDPISRKEIDLPPSGFVAGIYARNDIERAVYKAPANEVVRLALGFQTLLNKAQQEVLNPEGINCFRFFEGRGMRLWGARLISSDPEWKYVNLRRYFAYLERSIDKSTQWAVFEPNGEQLWANVRRMVEDFLLNEWQGGALLGDKPEKAFFVRCDRSTMTQNDLDNGRLVCLIGIAPLKPAEFVIFRIGQWTSDRRI
jgi:phage tail sheath protein FI